MLKICKYCNNDFLLKNKSQLFCSNNCRIKYKSEAISKTKNHNLICKNCNKPFNSYYKRKWCSDECSAHGRKILSTPPFNHLNSSTKGALYELKVSIDLMNRGYHVFRALSPASICDLIIVCNKISYKIEVTSGSLLSNNKIIWNKHEEENYDILAIVIDGNEILYMPELPNILGEL